VGGDPAGCGAGAARRPRSGRLTMSTLATVRHYARIYRRLQAQYIKSRLQYRADFVVASLGMVVTAVVTIVLFWVLFRSVPDIAGWTFDELLFIYGFYLLAISPMQVLFDAMWSLRMDVTEGAFIKYYFRPLNMLFYYVSERFDLKGISQVVIGVAVLVTASARLDLEWSVISVLLLIAVLIGAALVQIGVMVTAASMAFWMTDSWPVLSFAWRLREFAPYPITIMSGFMRILLTYVLPVAFIAFYPASVFVRRGEVPRQAAIAPLVGIAAFAIAYQVWRAGTRRWSGTGS
jgi:ABC-2 type transport system permease protein